MTVFQIDFEGDNDNLIRHSQNRVTSGVDLGYGDAWNSFLVSTSEHAVSNPRKRNMIDSDGDVTSVSMRIEGSVAAYNTGWGYNGHKYAPTNSYNKENIVSLLGDHIWFAQGKGTSETIKVVFEGLKPGTYDLTSYVNYTVHDPIRTYDMTVGGKTIRVAGQEVEGSGEAVRIGPNSGTIKSITVGSDGKLVASFEGVAQADGRMDPSIAGLMLKQISGSSSSGSGSGSGSDSSGSGSSGSNRAPLAERDAVETAAGKAIRLDPTKNDSDPDGGSLTITSVGKAGSGQTTLNTDGTITYTPNPGFAGQDNFSYRIEDGRGGTDVARVDVTVSKSGTTTPRPTPVPQPDPGDTAPDHDGAAYTMSRTIDVSKSGDVVNLAGKGFLQFDDATICLSFTADTVSGTRGLFSRDAGGFSGGGNHFSAYIEGGTLKARFQNATDEVVLTKGGIVAGREYHVGFTFADGEVAMYLDGVRVDREGGLPMSWGSSKEYVQIGALGWASATGGSGYDNVFDGRIGNVAVYDKALGASAMAAVLPQPKPQPVPDESPEVLLSIAQEVDYHNLSKVIPKIVLDGDFTISAYVAFDRGTSVDNRDAIVGDGSMQNGNDLNFYNGQFRLYTTDAKPRDVVISSTKASAGEGHHYAVTREDGVTRLYVDGKLEDISDAKWTDDFVISEIGGGVQAGGLDGSISGLLVSDEAMSGSAISDAASDYFLL